jgi:hypothetical protein
MKAAYVVAYASHASVIVPIATLFLLRDFRNTLVICVSCFLLASFIADTLSLIEATRGNSNLYIINTHLIIQFVLLNIFYSNLLSRYKRIIYLSGVGFLLYFVLITVCFQGIEVFQTIVRPIDSALLILYSSFYWYNLYVTQPTSELSNYPPFWFNLAIFGYFTLNLLPVAISYYITQPSNEDSMLIWSWHNLNNIAKNILFAIGIFYLKASESAEGSPRRNKSN